MRLYNIVDHSENVSYAEGLCRGLGRGRGLFFPTAIPQFQEMDDLLALDFVSRAIKILGALIGDEIPPDKLAPMVTDAFNFPVETVPVSDNVYALELFHGPTLAFKDFGARFMARCLQHFASDDKITILTATSGDTGAAVAHAFHGLPGINVAVLYPKGKISALQEKLFCTLGGNIHTFAVEADFDACQHLVKTAFDDDALRERIGLNSANSINISRLIAQCCYYFEAVARIPARDHLVIAVPSGNFGNLTAGLMARAMGLPVKRFIAATNVNDTVPRFLGSGKWEPAPTVPTLSNAMDVSRPNNWPRIVELFKRRNEEMEGLLSGRAVDDAQTRAGLRALYNLGYLSEPHGAVAYQCLTESLAADECGVFLGTAHPAKFRESVQDSLGVDMPLPEALAAVADKSLLSETIPADFAVLSDHLERINRLTKG